jgi:transcriptional regulator with XRE-family HTH domain
METVVPELPEVFGAVLSRYRKRQGWSQMTLAMKAGLHLNAVSNLERGKRGPSLHTVLLLSRALKVPAAKLIAAVEKAEPKL